MIIWLVLIIPIITLLILRYNFHNDVVAWEYVLLFGISVGSIFLSKIIVETTQTTDIEYFGGWVTEAVFYEEWNEYIHRTCTRTVSCGKNCTRTQTYDCSYVSYHPEYWDVINSNGRKISINKRKFDELTKKFKVKPVFINMQRDYHTIDGDAYKIRWNGDISTQEPTVTSNTYENRVRVSNSVFRLDEPPVEIFNEYGLYHYPEINDFYKQNELLGFNDLNSAKKLALLNARLGASKEVKVFIMVFRNQPREAGLYQKQQWQGGNQNEINITIGIDSENNIKWCEVFSWTEVGEIPVEIRSFVEKQRKLDLGETINFLEPLIKKKYIRMPFEKFSYLSVEPEPKHIFISFIVNLIICIIVAIFVVNNEHVNNHSRYYKKWKN